jgi:hypothetical protein
MEWAEALQKAALTATTVALILALAQRLGRRIAGVLAGLPTVTGPALVWLALEHGSAHADAAAIGSIAACVACALFALVYERVSRRAGIVVTGVAATLVFVAVAPPLQWLASDLAPALLLAGGATLAIRAAMPRGRDVQAPARGLPVELVATALVSGLVSGAVALLGGAIGPFWSGVLASPPLIAAAVAMHQHARGGGAAIRPFLRGYVEGLLGRAVFGASFAILLIPLGLIGATLVAAAAGCVCGCVWTGAPDRASFPNVATPSATGRSS